MPYHINFSAWNGVFAVPNCLTDQFLSSVSGYYIKVFLYFLRHSESSVDDFQQVAEATGGSVQDVKEAVGYWKANGMLTENSFAKESQDYKKPVQKRSNVTIISDRPPTVSSSEIAKIIAENKQVRFLCEQVEALFGKPLSPAEQRGVITMADWLNLPPDVILMICDYCVSAGHKNIRYIERTAANWVDLGITTHEQAEKKINELQQSHSWQQQVSRCFGIGDRSLSENEKKYIELWFRDYGFSLEMVQLAYEKTVDTIGKLNFKYIDKILKGWYEDKITNTEDAKKEHARPQAKEGKKTSYDLEVLDRIGLEVPKI